MFFGFLPFVAAGAISAVSQIFATYYVLQMNFDNKLKFEDSYLSPSTSVCERENTSYFLVLICLVVFNTMCLQDVKETFAFYSYLKRIPMAKGSPEEIDLLNRGQASALSVTKTYLDANGKECKMETFGADGFLHKWERGWAYFWLIAQLSAENFLILVGSGFVLYSPDHETLILNAVALTFILEIDDADYSYTMTKQQKALLEGLPQFGFANAYEGNLGGAAYLFKSEEELRKKRSPKSNLPFELMMTPAQDVNATFGNYFQMRFSSYLHHLLDFELQE